MSGRLDPRVVVGEAGIGAHGADDRVAGGSNARGALEKMLQHAAKIAATSGDKAGGMNVPVDGTERQVVIASHAEWVVPVHEHFFDRFAFRVVADEALPLVPLKRRFRFHRASDCAF